MKDVMNASLSLPKESESPYSPFRPAPSCQLKMIHISTGTNLFIDLQDSQIIELLQKGPVVASVFSYNWQYYRSGILSCSSLTPLFIDHAVLIVGYTPSYWIVKNQWGTQWGMNGFAHVTRSYYRKCWLGITTHVFTGVVSN